MAITIAQGFKVAGQESIDSRLVLTKSEMLAKLKGEMPNNYFCICKDDGKLYIWNSTFDKDAELGRFRSYEDIINISDAINKALQSEETKAQLEAAVAEVVPGAIEQAIADPESESAKAMTTAVSNTIVETFNNTSDPTAAEEIVNAMFNTNQFEQGIDNKVTLAVSVIQAIGNVE